MKTRNYILAICFAAAMAVSAVPAQAQVEAAAAAAEIVAPIVVHTLKPTKKTDTSGIWMPAEIIHADANSMVVSEQGNERVIHTFTYSDTVKDRMQKIVDKGGYQYGDKVKIQYSPGQTVAMKIHGKPSKAQ
jgi:hypothetical protein